MYYSEWTILVGYLPWDPLCRSKSTNKRGNSVKQPKYDLTCQAAGVSHQCKSITNRINNKSLVTVTEQVSK